MADIGIGPAVEAALLQPGQIIRHQPVAQPIALIDHGVEIVGPGIEGDAHGVAQPRGEGLLVAAVGGEALHRGMGQGILADVVQRADGDEEALAVGGEDDIARPVMHAGAEGIGPRHHLGLVGGAVAAELHAPEPVGPRDIEIAILNGEAVGPLEAGREDRLELGLAVAVLVAQQQNLAQIAARRGTHRHWGPLPSSADR